MAKFRKKPVVIEAEQFVPGPKALGCHDPSIAVTIKTGETFMGYPVLCDEKGPFIYIPTLEGQMRANPSDWIITGVKGERYPCKPDVFEATYEPAE